MMSHRVAIQSRIARFGAVEAAVAALGATPQEPWETVRSSLPPIGPAPGAKRLPNRGVVPGIPLAIPQQMPPRPADRGGKLPAGVMQPNPT